MENYQDINAATIDRWAEAGWQWAKPVSAETYHAALNGNWQIVLTPTKPVPRDWFPDLNGCRVLGLASGGGQQMPILQAAGAICTVLDYSDRQLASERIVAAREGYDITIVKADMSKPLPFDDEAFDLIVHPISNCYIEKVEPLFRECVRILKPGGLLLGGYEIGINYIVDEAETAIVNALPFNPLHNEANLKQLQATDSGFQFSHTLEEQIGGQLKAGFILTDLYEDSNGEGRLHALGIPSFVAIRAQKPM